MVLTHPTKLLQMHVSSGLLSPSCVLALGKKVEDDTECVALDLGELVICAVTSSTTIIIIIRNGLLRMSLTLPGICKGIMGSKALSHSLPHLKPTRQEGKDPECSHFTDEKTELSKVKPRACPISDS